MNDQEPTLIKAGQLRRKIDDCSGQIDLLMQKANSAQSSYELREAWVHIEEMKEIRQQYVEELNAIEL